MLINENSFSSQSEIPKVKPDKNVDSVEGLGKYATIYFRWFINNFRDKRLEEKKERQRRQLDLLSFIKKGFNKTKIMKDYEKVLELRENDALGKNPQAMIFEHIVTENIELHNWLGDSALTYKTTEYDDRINHTDLVVEWDGEEGMEPIRLAIDCTIAESEEVLDKKVGYIVKELNNLRMTKIKYFESDIDNTAKTIQDVPRIILAIDRNKLEELCKDFINLSVADSAWQENYLQLFFLREVEEQLIMQLKLLEKDDKNIKYLLSRHTDYSKEKIMSLSDKLKTLLELIRKIIKEKTDAMPEDTLARVKKYIANAKAPELIKKYYQQAITNK